MSDLQYLKEKLLEQLSLLTDAAEGYDRGRKSQALHIATVLRTLFSNSKGGKGLVFQILSLHQRSIFLNSSCPRFDRPPRLFIGLVDYLVRDGIGEVVPHLDGSVIPDGQYFQFGRIVDYDGPAPERADDVNHLNQLTPKKWLNEAVFVLSPQHRINRQFLFGTAANQDGGAHVDPELHPLYERLKGLGGTNIEFQLRPDMPPLRFYNVPYPALRQIAFEIITSSAVRSLAAGS